MTRGKLIIGGAVLTLFLSAGRRRGDRSTAPPVASFKGSIDMVRVAAVVRDHKGRFVRDLTARDFEVLDGGQTRPIADLQPDIAGISVAVLFDVSGSMEGHLPNAREAATHVLSWMDAVARRSGGLHVRHASRRAHAVHRRFARVAGFDQQSCRSARRRCTTRLR